MTRAEKFENAMRRAITHLTIGHSRAALHALEYALSHPPAEDAPIDTGPKTDLERCAAAEDAPRRCPQGAMNEQGWCIVCGKNHYAEDAPKAQSGKDCRHYYGTHREDAPQDPVAEASSVICTLLHDFDSTYGTCDGDIGLVEVRAWLCSRTAHWDALLAAEREAGR